MNEMSLANSLVCVVDDDDAVRLSVGMLLEGAGYQVRAFASGGELLASPDTLAHCSCLILDVRMPGMSGLTVQERLLELASKVPIVFISGHGDVPMVARTMRLGAADFLQKPFNEEDLLQRIQQSCEKFARERADHTIVEATVTRVNNLTRREHDVLRGMLVGKLNKVIASDLGIRIKTVEQHRARIMEKMQVDSLAELVRLIVSAGIKF